MLKIGLLAIALASGQTARASPDPIVTGTHFFALDGEYGQLRALETRTIPYRPGSSCYQWVVMVKPEPRMLRVREVFDLPASAQQWSANPLEATSVDRDKAGALTEFDDSLDDGMIAHSWCVVEGDPVGSHRIRVYAGERLLHDFRFQILLESH